MRACAICLLVVTGAPTVAQAEDALGFVVSYLGGAFIDEVYDRVTDKPNVRVLNQRLKELEKKAGLNEEMRKELAKLQAETAARAVTREEFRTLATQVGGELSKLRARIEDHEERITRLEVENEDLKQGTRNSKSAEYFVNRGKEFAAKKDLGQALANYAIAIKLEPKCFAAYRGRREIHKSSGAWGLVLEECLLVQKVLPQTKPLVALDKESYDVAFDVVAAYVELWRLSDLLDSSFAPLPRRTPDEVKHFLASLHDAKFTALVRNSKDLQENIRHFAQLEALNDLRECVARCPSPLDRGNAPNRLARADVKEICGRLCNVLTNSDLFDDVENIYTKKNDAAYAPGWAARSVALMYYHYLFDAISADKEDIKKAYPAFAWYLSQEKGKIERTGGAEAGFTVRGTHPLAKKYGCLAGAYFKKDDISGLFDQRFYLDVALSVDPKDPQTILMLADYYRRTGKHENRAKWVDAASKVTELAPDHPAGFKSLSEAYSDLANVESRIGNTAESARHSELSRYNADKARELEKKSGNR